MRTFSSSTLCPNTDTESERVCERESEREREGYKLFTHSLRYLRIGLSPYLFQPASLSLSSCDRGYNYENGPAINAAGQGQCTVDPAAWQTVS